LGLFTHYGWVYLLITVGFIYSLQLGLFTHYGWVYLLLTVGLTDNFFFIALTTCMCGHKQLNYKPN